MKSKRTLIVFTTTLIATLLLGFFIPSSPKPVLPTTYYIPSIYDAEKLFKLTNVRTRIDSSYWEESSLINYSSPVADSDYMLPYGWKEHVYLPGDSRDYYQFQGSYYILGSGSYETWRTPNGGEFAFLHLTSGYGYARTSYVSQALRIEKLQKTSDATGYIAARVFSRQNLGLSYVQGGTFVGISGWPTYPAYANGSYGGPNDSHLCVVTDALALQWFDYLLNRGPNPYVFNFSKWRGWTNYHHKKKISPYYNGSFRTIARAWNDHYIYRCGSVVTLEHYFAQGYMRQRFQACLAYSWPTHPSWKAKFVRARFIY